MRFDSICSASEGVVFGLFDGRLYGMRMRKYRKGMNQKHVDPHWEGARRMDRGRHLDGRWDILEVVARCADRRRLLVLFNCKAVITPKLNGDV